MLGADIGPLKSLRRTRRVVPCRLKDYLAHSLRRSEGQQTNNNESAPLHWSYLNTAKALAAFSSTAFRVQGDGK